MDAVVTAVIDETPDTRTLVLDVGAVPSYRAGQYVSIDPHQFPGLRNFVSYLEHLKRRREAPRAYSMSSAPHEPLLAVTIKEERYDADQTVYPPLLSTYLVHEVRARDTLTLRGVAGGYMLPDDVERRAAHVLHVCAGSGGVPNFAMVKDSLARHASLRHTFVYSNRTWDDVIFRDALGELQARHPDRLRVVHTLTRESDQIARAHAVRRGRVDLELLGDVLRGEAASLVYVCGPAVTVWERRAHAARGTAATPRFMETVRAHLAALAVPPDSIKIESYG
jgi:ferredoxin-NADP reductase